MKAPVSESDYDLSANVGDEHTPPSISTPLDNLVLPPHLKTIWANANSILVDSSAIVQAPGDNSVKSLSGQKPHYVHPSKGCGGFVCDGECLGYRSTKICAHTVAAALNPLYTNDALIPNALTTKDA